MRTTLDVDDTLLRRARKRAAEDGTTLTAVVEQALAEHLAPPPAGGGRFRLKLLTKKGRTLRGVDLSDRDALYERMEGR